LSQKTARFRFHGGLVLLDSGGRFTLGSSAKKDDFGDFFPIVIIVGTIIRTGILDSRTAVGEASSI
jgi:hypothetical protein